MLDIEKYVCTCIPLLCTEGLSKIWKTHCCSRSQIERMASTQCKCVQRFNFVLLVVLSCSCFCCTSGLNITLEAQAPIANGTINNETWVTTMIDGNYSTRIWPYEGSALEALELSLPELNSSFLEVTLLRFGYISFKSSKRLGSYNHICLDMFTTSDQTVLTVGGYFIRRDEPMKLLSHTILAKNSNFTAYAWNSLKVPLSDAFEDTSWYQVELHEKSVQGSTLLIRNLKFCNDNDPQASGQDYYQCFWNDDRTLRPDSSSAMRLIEPVFLSGFGLAPSWRDMSYTGFFDFSYVLPSGDLAIKSLVGPNGALSLRGNLHFGLWKAMHFDILASSNEISLCFDIQEDAKSRDIDQCVYSMWNQTDLGGNWVNVAVPLESYTPWQPWNRFSLIDNSTFGVFFIVTNILFNMNENSSASEIWVLEVSNSPADMRDIQFQIPSTYSGSRLPGWSIGIVVGIVVFLVIIPLLLCIIFPSKPGKRLKNIPLCCVAAHETVKDVIEDITFSPRLYHMSQVPNTVKMKAADRTGWVESSSTLTNRLAKADSNSINDIFPVYGNAISPSKTSEGHSVDSLPSPWKRLFGQEDADLIVTPKKSGRSISQPVLPLIQSEECGDDDQMQVQDLQSQPSQELDLNDIHKESYTGRIKESKTGDKKVNAGRFSERTARSFWFNSNHRVQSARADLQAHLQKMQSIDETLKESCKCLMDATKDLMKMQRLPSSQKKLIRRVASDNIEASIAHNYHELLERQIRALQDARQIVAEELKSLRDTQTSRESPDERQHMTTTMRTLDRAPSRTDLESMHVDFVRDVQITGLIGSGGSGNVYHGLYKGHRVAIKMLHNNDAFTKEQIDSLKAEVNLLQHLRHANIINFLGSCVEPPNICIILEYAEGGSLHNMLHNNLKQPEYGTLLQLAEDVASAMDYCHSLNPPIIHRDLKPQNILLRRDGRAQVADFGIARIRKTTYVETKHLNAGTVAYMAPEMMQGEKVDEKCDVYSFGVIMWECLTGQKPWSDKLLPMQVVMSVGVEGQRLPVPIDCPISLRKLIKDCWRHDPRLRPTFREIKLRLAYIRNKHGTH